MLPIADTCVRRERVVALLKEEQVLSLVDGAHAIGQVPVDLTATQPDFFLSNMHKWLFAQRGAAFLYVDPKCVLPSPLPPLVFICGTSQC